MSEFRGGKFGSAGKNLDGKASDKFGRNNARAGAVGERYLSNAIRKHPQAKMYTMYQSLMMPKGKNNRRQVSPRFNDVDIDFAIASGNKVVLVDCKMWSSKYFYWSLAGHLMKNFSMGDRLSKNMEMARAKLREELPGCQVEAIVCFVPVKGGRLPRSVGFLIWPGRIRSYMPNDALMKITRVLGSPSLPSHNIQAVLGKLTR